METPAANQGESPCVTLEGAYTPSDFLEEPITLDRSDYTAEIAKGHIKVTFRNAEPLPDAVRQTAVDRDIRQVFAARTIFTCQPWQITELRLNRHYPDGRKDVWLSVTSGFCFVSGSPADFIHCDAEGNVIKDTKAERLADQRGFQDQCLRHAENALLQGLMASFGRAVADPADRMTHLYEIRDALSRHLGGEKEARKVLGLTNVEWSDLGRIANHEPIEESRHRGNHTVLRQATEAEKTRAIEVARRMIRAYLDQLDHSLRGTISSKDHTSSTPTGFVDRVP
jgi:hypothetical protein